MPLRVALNGDERDKDVANAIRYAVDNGARVINLSIAKPYSPNAAELEAVFRYAQSQDVLIVHAAGNGSIDLDRVESFPTLKSSQGEIENWIEVAASTAKADSGLVSQATNYGKNSVDVFAPGYQIESSVPGQKRASKSGTSMAAPHVAGIAARIWAQFPKLSGKQVKQCILSGVRRYQGLVVDRPFPPGPMRKEKVAFEDLSRTGGVVDARSSLKLAARLSSDALN